MQAQQTTLGNFGDFSQRLISEAPVRNFSDINRTHVHTVKRQNLSLHTSFREVDSC